MLWARWDYCSWCTALLFVAGFNKMHRGYSRAVIALSFLFALPSSFKLCSGALLIAQVEAPGCWIAAAAAAGNLWSIDFYF
jgi:hypothetical protein